VPLAFTQTNEKRSFEISKIETVMSEITMSQNTKSILYKKLRQFKSFRTLGKTGERLPKVQLQHSFDVLLPVQRACNEHGLIVWLIALMIKLSQEEHQ